MTDTVPYWLRIVLLLALMSLVAVVDRHRNGPKATKAGEYFFLLASGILGSLFGFLNDLVTSCISSDYFAYGKGLGPGDGLTLRAAVLGLEAGFAAGAVAGAICLYVNTCNSTRPPLPYARLLRFLWRPVVLAVFSAWILATLFHQRDPLGLATPLADILDSERDSERIQRFLIVWWIHLGLYLGLLVSVVWISVDIARLRRRLPPLREIQ